MNVEITLCASWVITFNLFFLLQTLSNGRVVALKEKGETEYVKFEDIKEFLSLAVNKRLNEFNEQVNVNKIIGKW